MKKIKIDKIKFLENRSYIEPDNLPMWARLAGNDEIVAFYYDEEAFESERQKYEMLGFGFVAVEWA